MQWSNLIGRMLRIIALAFNVFVSPHLSHHFRLLSGLGSWFAWIDFIRLFVWKFQNLYFYTYFLSQLEAELGLCNAICSKEHFHLFYLILFIFSERIYLLSSENSKIYVAPSDFLYKCVQIIWDRFLWRRRKIHSEFFLFIFF